MNTMKLRERCDGIREELRKGEKMEEHARNAYYELVRVLGPEDSMWDALDDLLHDLRDAQVLLLDYLKRTRKEYRAQRKIEKGA